MRLSLETEVVVERVTGQTDMPVVEDANRCDASWMFFEIFFELFQCESD